MNTGTHTFLVSDTHFNHAKILNYTRRPFENIEQMNRKLINNWNNAVRPQDNVYILGDYILSYGGKDTFKKINEELKGHKFLILGNHDRYTNHWLLNNGIDFVCTKCVLEIAGKKVCMIHDPAAMHKVEREAYDIVLHGHIHENKENKQQKRNRNLYNVNVELNNYAPIRIERILQTFSNRVDKRENKEKLRRIREEFNVEH